MTSTEKKWVLGLIIFAVVVGLTFRACFPPPPPGPTPAQVQAESLRVEVVRAQAYADSLRSLTRLDSVALDALSKEAHARTREAQRYRTQADSAVAAARSNSLSHAVRVAAYETALAFKDSTIAQQDTALATKDTALTIARHDIVLLTRATDSLRTVTFNLTRSNTDLSADVTTWKRRAQRKWYACAGAGGSAVVAGGVVRAGPAAFAGVCRVFRLPWER